MDESTDLSAANARAAALRSVDYSTVALSQDQVDSTFGDQTVVLPKGVTRPGHWPEIDADDWSEEFYNQWRAWQKENGFDPDNPDG